MRVYACTSANVGEVGLRVHAKVYHCFCVTWTEYVCVRRLINYIAISLYFLQWLGKIF